MRGDDRDKITVCGKTMDQMTRDELEWFAHSLDHQIAELVKALRDAGVTELPSGATIAQG